VAPAIGASSFYNAAVKATVRLSSSRPHSDWEFDVSESGVVLRCESGSRVTTLYERGRVCMTWTDPLLALEWMEARCHGGGLAAGARWVGYLSYDLGRLFEELPAVARDDLGLPLFVFSLHTPHERRQAGLGRYAISQQPLESNFSPSAYQTAVARAMEYIAAGDIFQVNLSQRFTAGLPEQPSVIYERLWRQAPALYGAYLDFVDHALLSNSPELFLHISKRPDGSRRVVTRPIKGTRARMPGMDLELRDSVKDQAELNMIVDLERNDLGRVCEIGSVKVVEPRRIEAHPTVYHGVAGVEGVLRGEVGFVDLLRATFPGGSVTGAPKIRAMQIIDELEPTRRGPYCGAIGYVAVDGSMEFNIAIRTMIVENGRVHVPVGGGVVADSTPQAEYRETLVKAQAMLAALGYDIPADP
jgi:anthranilate/para-aminobenzoate synthase component I